MPGKGIRMERMRQNMTGYRMPAYIEEILTENYCRNFMRMSIVKESDRYLFNYKPESYVKLDPYSMNLYDKLLLLRNLISMIENNDDHLISPETYLIEPELVYVNGGRVDAESLKLMYYPDIKKLDLRYKIVLFADRIMNKNLKEEREMAEKIREVSEAEDINRIKLFLDRNILKIESRMNEGGNQKHLKA